MGEVTDTCLSEEKRRSFPVLNTRLHYRLSPKWRPHFVQEISKLFQGFATAILTLFTLFDAFYFSGVLNRAIMFKTSLFLPDTAQTMLR